MDKIADLLNEKFLKYNHTDFIDEDPISIPHQFTEKQDIEIAGLFAAVLAWGQRKTIINKCNELMERMDNSPYQFILNAEKSDLKALEGFKHRTFNDFDLLFFVEFLKSHYIRYQSLEDAFLMTDKESENVKNNLIGFRNYFLDGIEAKVRTMKHVATPARNSACKRLNMFLRWMIRDDKVDFGLWKRFKPTQLIIPCDIHVEKTARRLGLTQRNKPDWMMAEEITEQLKTLDPNDPVKYDFALFGMGIEGYFSIKS